MSLLKKKGGKDKPIWGPVQLLGVVFSLFYFFFYQDIVLKFTGEIDNNNIIQLR